MLRSLTIRDVVLIERLELDAGAGLSVLTGETGAGKSILLDALGLALGGRAEQRLVRRGADKAVVAARFDAPGDAVSALLDEHGVDADDDELILRRVLSADGRSKAFINDQPVGVALLKAVGEALVEVHGQFENHRLMRPALHRPLLDGYGGLADERARTAETHAAWTAARDAVDRRAAELADAERLREDLSHAVDELSALDPQPGEDAALSDRRHLLMNAEKLAEALSEATGALSDGRGVEHQLQQAVRGLIRAAEKGGDLLQPAIDALGRAQDAAAEAAQCLERVEAELDLDAGALDALEERLFAIRAAARKHGVPPDDLPDLRASLQTRLDDLEDGQAGLEKLRRAEVEARRAYETAADALTARRTRAAEALDAAVNGELPPLKLDKAAFRTRVAADADPKAWGPDGRDTVTFEVATNPGAPFGPLGKIASGGEIARFMLALKAVLAASDSIPTLIFDEVDTGIGGAVAAAVGERLARLGAGAQVLVVTHSPQVAARGGVHYRVSKAAGHDDAVTTTVESLDGGPRTEEIARMLAGETVTDEARAAARALLGAEAA
jgi:DNA repair protein RecN (Recombination protein N)